MRSASALSRGCLVDNAAKRQLNQLVQLYYQLGYGLHRKIPDFSGAGNARLILWFTSKAVNEAYFG
ncbi:MAG: hypothetical protein KME46_00045 [Brasilonema angustatum HA4187-MV1]|jgi:hypothetical protein|nr:hypothetical protein [Brasilonema angustatum HA4187-MV1]